MFTLATKTGSRDNTFSMVKTLITQKCNYLGHILCSSLTTSTSRNRLVEVLAVVSISDQCFYDNNVLDDNVKAVFQCERGLW